MFFYSFTQIDLGLTLSKWSVWQVAQKFFQNIGYFQRPLSSLIFVFLVLALFIFYLLILYAVKKNKFTRKQAWFLIISTTVILTFSYNAFSYDLFNYIFDAKIITHYLQNPYVQKALDYPYDPMLSFMHWTHRTYPYGPVWLALTVPLSYVGLQFFLPTFFLFKTLVSLSFLGTAFFIGKILRKVSAETEIFGIIFFALNPLVVLESLVSSHNDMVMIFFAIFALYLIMGKKYVRSLILLILSIGIKFATVFMIPVFLFIYFFDKSRKVNWEKLFVISTLLMITPVVLVSFRTNYQPWYLLYILPFAALIARKYYFFIPSMILSLASILQYLPFLYLGNWDKPVSSILFWMTTSSIVFSVFFSVIWFAKLRLAKRK